MSGTSMYEQYDPSLDDVRRIVEQVAAGAASEADLLAAARWAQRSPDNRTRLRNWWPDDQLPVIDDYFCTRRLGQGAAGTVFEAVSLRGEPSCIALKLLQFSASEEEDRFRAREVAILKSISCPNVARYLDSGTAGSMLYLAMDLVRGVPLDAFVADRGLSLEEKVALFQRLCVVVADLHDTGVVHRDLKPRHVLVDERGQPRIVDFGLSKVCGDDWPTRVRRARTELGFVMGTVKYMSPEQAWGGLLKVDHRTDLWSLGIMLFEIVTDGDYPFSLDAVGELVGHDALLHRLQTEVPRRPRITTGHDPEALATLIARCLAHEPRHRIESARALAEDLQRWLDTQRIRTRQLPWRYRVQRLAVGLATHARGALRVATVAGTLVFVFALTLLPGVRWRAAGEDFGPDTRRALAALGTDRNPVPIVVVGITDECSESVPVWAADHDLGAVTGHVTTWRAVHGQLMERLARAGPRVVAWDFYFQRPTAQDAAFVAGAQALHDAGVPLVVATTAYLDDGTPDLSPDIVNTAGAGVAARHHRRS